MAVQGLHGRPQTWADVQKALNDSYLDALIQFDRDNMTEEQVKTLGASLQGLTKEQVAGASVAVASIFSWLQAMHAYGCARLSIDITVQLSPQSATPASPTAAAEPGYLGLAIAPSEGVPGVRITDVAPNGPAWDAGLRNGDIITSFGGILIKPGSKASFSAAVKAQGGAGNRVVVLYLHDTANRVGEPQLCSEAVIHIASRSSQSRSPVRVPEHLEPALRSAKEAMNCVSKADIMELKSLINPPAAVVNTLVTVQAVLGEPETWAAAKTNLTHTNEYMMALINLQGVGANGFTKLHRYVESCPVESVRCVSISAASLSKWLHALYSCERIRRTATQE
jgi:membrane-associated protease RseP (regulator of RpoE activity)